MVFCQRVKLLESEPPSFSHAPAQSPHLSTEEIRSPVFQCPRRHRILECHEMVAEFKITQCIWI